MPYKELRVHLEQINSSENIPMSTLLRTLPVKDEKYSFRLFTTDSLCWLHNLVLHLTIEIFDNSGPCNVSHCRTTGLVHVDLSDTEGFDAVDMEGTVYGFELSRGVYERKKLETPENVTFSQLVFVNGAAKGYEHKLFWNSMGKWEVLQSYTGCWTLQCTLNTY